MSGVTDIETMSVGIAIMSVENIFLWGGRGALRGNSARARGELLAASPREGVVSGSEVAVTESEAVLPVGTMRLGRRKRIMWGGDAIV